MKQAIRHLSYPCLLSLLIASGAAAAQELQPASALSTAAIAGATIVEWRDAVHLSLPGQPVSNPKRGEQLPAGTILDTGSGKMLLYLKDGSEVLVRPHTRLQIEQPSISDPSYLQLLLGRIRALISKRTGGAVSFELGTPSAVIAVRGTQFEVEVNRYSITEVDVIDGLVQVSGRRASLGSVLVGAGFSTRVGFDSGPDQPRPTNEIRPEVERPNHGEVEASKKSDIEIEFEKLSDREDQEAEDQKDPVDSKYMNDTELPGEEAGPETDQPENVPENPLPGSPES